MKLLNIADLHIGKRVNEFNMLEDQKYILEQILRITDGEKPDGVLIAGDVYNKSQPSAEAVEVLDEFLTQLTAFGKPVFMISGNHDSPERLSFGSRIMKKNRLHIAGVFDGALQKVTLEDEHGIVNIYLLPFLKPAMVKPFFEQSIEYYDEAVRAVISAADINKQERNILLVHQFVMNGTQQPERSECQSGRGSVKDALLNALKGFLAVSLFTVVPVELFKLSVSLQSSLTSGITGYGSSIDVMTGDIMNELIAAGTPDGPASTGAFSGFSSITSPIMTLFIIIMMGYAVIKVFFSNL